MEAFLAGFPPGPGGGLCDELARRFEDGFPSRFARGARHDGARAVASPARRGGGIALLLVAGMWSSPARAQTAVATPPPGRPPPARRQRDDRVSPSEPRSAFLRQEDLGGVLATQFVPSLVGLAYVKVAPRVYLRPGVRLGVAGAQSTRWRV